MEANELRIGNLVTIAGESNTSLKEVKSFYSGGIHVGFGETHRFSLVLPIELTVDWLIKLGFTNPYSGSLEFTIEKTAFVIQYFSYTKMFHFTGGEGVQFGVGCKYVHQLQNLYFALTNEELELK